MSDPLSDLPPDRPADSPRLLARAMAKAAGVDLDQASRIGAVSADEVSDLVLSCSRCSAWQECPSWLADRDGAAAAPAPGYCRNRASFDDVLRRLTAES